MFLLKSLYFQIVMEEEVVSILHHYLYVYLCYNCLINLGGRYMEDKKINFTLKSCLQQLKLMEVTAIERLNKPMFFPPF